MPRSIYLKIISNIKNIINVCKIILEVICSPLELEKIAGNATNNLPMPQCWEWNCDKVCQWLTKVVGLPDYEVRWQKRQ